ncbi:Myc-type [Macleaya cordata]|uniref:Myc-type n=1 Tax=Macleaya cordata TaxID=56857 RepID=A0A200PPI1_MACCD|nr:Myc-type [Macleaya cordata]
MAVNNYMGMDYSLDHHQQQQQQQNQHHLMKHTVRVVGENSGENNEGTMVDYMFNNNTPQPQQISSGFCSSTSLDRLSFAEVMQFADFGPKLALNQQSAASSGKNIISDEEDTTGIIDPVYFLKFPVLSDRFQQDDDQNNLLLAPPPQIPTGNDNHEVDDRFNIGDQITTLERNKVIEDNHEEGEEEEEARVISENTTTSLNNRLRFLGGNNLHHQKMINMNPSSEVVITKNSRRKRPRSVKTSEEVESQRMTHIAVERNRRKQMNEHLRVLRSLMPGSYVQRGDQASIIGGAIEFVRELEQLLQCLESQKRRRLFGGSSTDSSSSLAPAQPPFFPSPNLPLPNDQIKLVDIEQAAGLREETAENKSCLADVEVKLLGMDAMIKILSRRRPGQLLKTIAALEDLQLNILHTNITTIEQTVLYSFNVKVAIETRFTAEDIASSVQQIFNFIHASSTI